MITDINDSSISYISEGVPVSAELVEFLPAFDGNVLLSFPKPDAEEPDYRMHARVDFLIRAKKWILAFCALFLFFFLFISRGLYSHPAAWFIALIDLAGIYFTFLLVQKSVKIHNTAADRVCGVLQAGGCDSILETKASKFFGIFGWSEVGFSYFSVSLATLLLFPDLIPQLALCNICCLPFTVWSIWYQKFRAHKWCTLCVCVQCSLWLLFFSYLFVGYINIPVALNFHFIVLGVTYVGVMLGINAIMPLIERNSNSTAGE